MNITPLTQTKVALILALGLVSSLAAIERPGEQKNDSLPAEVLPQYEEDQKSQKPASHKVTWLGVRSEAVPDDLAWHLKLDSGVIVRVVDPASPAAEGGVKDRDIILKVGDLAVQNRDQVRTAITSKQPGEEVNLKLLRQGEPLDLKVTLGERELLPQVPGVPLLDDQLPGFAQIIPRGMNNDDLALLQQQLLKRVEDALKDGPAGAAGQMNLHLNDLLNGNIPGGQNFNLGIQNSGSFSFSDDQGNVVMTMNNDERQVKVTDPDGKVLFEGPYSTVEQRKAVPEKIRQRIDKLGLDQENGFRLQFRLGDEPSKKGQ